MLVFPLEIGGTYGPKFFEIAAMYGNIDIFNNYYANTSHIPLTKCIHIAIKHKRYNIIEWFLNKYYGNKNKEQTKSSNIYQAINTSKCDQCTILGTAIIANDLKAIKLIINFNEKIKKYNNHINNKNDNNNNMFLRAINKSALNMIEINSINVDDFVFSDNTALQTAFLFCDRNDNSNNNDNFAILKYLTNKHNPNYKEYDLNLLDKDDKYMAWKTVTQHREERKFNRFSGYHECVDVAYEVDIRYGLKDSITYKPDCEGVTIDERIQICRNEEYLTESQCYELQAILQKKRLNLS